MVDAVMDDAQATWEQMLGGRYRRTTAVLFRDAIQSGCGFAQSATGPFYCPADHKVYLDLGFFDELQSRFGAPGDFARAYVIAHELGHHVQSLMGTDAQVRRAQSARPDQQNALSVRAGAPGRLLRRRLGPPCRPGRRAGLHRVTIETGDVEAGLNAAAAIGDDRIQRMQTGHVAPDRFTHGIVRAARDVVPPRARLRRPERLQHVQVTRSRSSLRHCARRDSAAVTASPRPWHRMPLIGRSVPRREGRAKVTGQARYVDDFALPGMLYGATVRSQVARGRILGIDFDPGIPWDEFTIVTAADIPARNRVALIVDDQPYLASEAINHPEEPIVAPRASRSLPARGGAPARSRAGRAAARRVLDRRARSPRDRVIWGSDNIFKRTPCRAATSTRRGPSAALIVEGEYETGAQEQLYIEPNGMLAVASPETGVTVWGSMQCPYYIHKALAPLFGAARRQDSRRPDGNRRRVRRQGGVSVDDRRPRRAAGVEVGPAGEDRSTTAPKTWSRRPSAIRRGRAIGRRSTRDGKLLAMDIDFVIDGGAYCTLSPVVLSRGTIHAPGRTSARTCAFAAARWRRTRRRTARSAASARRRASSRSSATWIASPRPSGLTPGGVPPAQLHHAGPDERRRPGDLASRSTWPGCSIARSSCRTITRSARGSPRETGPGRCGRASASRRSCTAPASPDRARIISRRSWRSKRPTKAGCAS